MKDKTPEERAAEFSEYFRSCADLEQLRGTASSLELIIKKLPEDLQSWLRDEYKSVKENIEQYARNKQKS